MTRLHRDGCLTSREDHCGVCLTHLLLIPALHRTDRSRDGHHDRHESTYEQCRAHRRKGESSTRGLRERWFSISIVVLCVLLWASLPLQAQVQNGTIVGRVTDSGSSILPDATVTLTQIETNLVLHAKTNSAGEYTFPQLLPGHYQVSIEKQGFEKVVTTMILTVGQTARVDMTLPIGKVSETVTVTTDVGNLDTQTSNLDYTVQAKQLDELPLNGRNPYRLAVLAPGILPGAYFGAGVAVTRAAVVAAATNNFEDNGGIGGNNEVLLDGVSIVVCCQGQPAVTPSTEVVNQFKAVTSSGPAQYGRTSGAVLNIATKSGTNQLHGEFYDFLRNDKLDAADFFTKRSGIYPYPGHDDFRPPHRTNQFGIFVGGPIVMPRVYDGKNKAFFTFGYEGIRNLAPTTGTSTVPTALMREGVFTEAPTVVYDPNSYNATTNQRTPLAAATCNGVAYAAGYCVPQSEWSPVAMGLLQFFPAPNLPGIINNYFHVTNVTSTDDQYNFRIDYNASEKHRTFMRGTRSTDTYINNDLFNMPGGPSGWQQHITAYLFALGHTWVVSPSTLLQFTYGFARQTNYEIGNNFYKYNAANYGFSSNFVSQQQVTGLPSIGISGEVAPMYGAGFSQWAHYTHSLNATALIQKGKHNFAFGYQGHFVLENPAGLSGPTGTFSFGTNFTGGPMPQSSLPSGQSAFDGWAAFLLGDGTGNIARQTTFALSQWVTGLFFQDDWRILNHLTVNAGVRYDLETGFGERHNHWGLFDPDVINPISSEIGFTVRGGAQFLGANGNPTRTSQTIYHAVSPHFGLAYQYLPQTVFRAGYSINFLPLSERGYTVANVGFIQTTNTPSSPTGYTPDVTVDNPFPDGVALPAGASLGVGASVGSSISAFQYKNPLSYQQQWNVGTEQGLGRGTVFQLNYVGGHGVKLPINAELNDLLPAYFGKPGDASQVAYLQAQVPNPFYQAAGVASGSLLQSSTVQRAQLLTAFPQYTNGAISQIHDSAVILDYLDLGSATYNALQASLLVNRPGGLVASINYTFSKALGDVSDLTNGFLNSTGNPTYQNYYLRHQYEHSTLATDVRHLIEGTADYPLPFGRGAAHANDFPSWANQIVAGWSASIFADVYSGFPMSLTVSGATSFAGTRPVYTGAPTLTKGSTHQRLGGTGQSQGYFNPAGFRLPQVFEMGTVARSDAALRGPLNFDDDVSVIKKFPIHDSFSLEFRADAFNVLNKVAFGLPSTSFGSANFGYITYANNSPRNIQLAMKIHF